MDDNEAANHIRIHVAKIQQKQADDMAARGFSRNW